MNPAIAVASDENPQYAIIRMIEDTNNNFFLEVNSGLLRWEFGELSTELQALVSHAHMCNMNHYDIASLSR